MIDAALNPATRVLWRAADAVQLELGTRSVVLSGVDRRAIADLLGRPESDHQSPALGGVLPALETAGFLIRRRRRSESSAPPPRLAPQVTALRSRYGDRADAVFTRRWRGCVLVHGAGRLTAPIAAALAAGGVGRIAFAGQGDVHLHHCLPGGLTPGDEGQRFAAAAVTAVRRAAPDCATALDPEHPPELVVLTTDGPVDTDVREGLHANRRPHLVAEVGCETACAGPLVRPGRTSCLRCADLHRADRDPAWPALAVQLSRPDRHGGGADAALAVMIAGVVAGQALAYLDGLEPATVEGTLEVHLPDWRLRRRSWPPHPSCDCGAYSGRPAAAPVSSR